MAGKRTYRTLCASATVLGEQLVQYRFKGITEEPLYQHQLQTFLALVKNPVFLVANQPGTGKTRSLVCAAEARKQAGLATRALYLCPKAVRYAMAREIARWTDLTCTVLDGPTEKRAKQLADSDAFFFVCNYHGAVMLEKQLLKKGFDLLICDESTRVRTTGTQTHKAVAHIAQQCLARWLSTGTPMPRDPLDFFGQFTIMDRRIFGSKALFKGKYIKYGPRDGPIPKILGYQNEDDLARIVAKHSIRYLKSQCLDLPPKIFVTCDVPLLPKQQHVYDEFRQFLEAEMPSGTIVPIKSALSKFMRFQQVTSGFVGSAEACEWIGENAKLDYLEDLLDTLQLHENKVIVWCEYVPSIKMLQQKFQAMNPAMFYGEVPDQEAEIDRFNQDPSCRMLIGNASVGIGATMNVAQYVVYYELPYFDTEAFDQSQDRNHRIGQTNKVTYYLLMSPSTVDYTIWRNLQGKYALSDKLLGDDMRKMALGEV